MSNPTYQQLRFPEIIVDSLAKLPAPVAGVITLENNKTYRIVWQVNIGTNTIEVWNSSTIYWTDKSDDGIIYTWTGNAIQGTNKTCTISNILCFANNPLAIFFNFTNTTAYSIQIRECIIQWSCQCAFINWGSIVAINNNIIATWYGIDTTGTIRKLAIDTNFFENPATEEHIHIETGTYDTISITNNDFSINSPNPAILVDTVTISNQWWWNVVGNRFSGTGTFISGIDDTTDDWIIEDNWPRVLNTSARRFVRKIRSEAQLHAFLAMPDALDYIYEIDGIVNFTSPIVVPYVSFSKNLTINGYGNNFSEITTNQAIDLFTWGGNLYFNNIRLTAPVVWSRLFNLTDPAWSSAIEMVNVNIESTKDVWVLNGYRQWLRQNAFFAWVEQGFLFQGTRAWGFRIDVGRLIFTVPWSTYMFKSDVWHTFWSRFGSNANSTITTWAIWYDFRENSFVNDATFQLIEAQFNWWGTYVAPTITASSRKSLWRDCVWVDDTYQWIVINNTTDTVTDIITQNVRQELAVTKSILEKARFTENAGNTFSVNYDSTLPINIWIELFLSLSSWGNNEIEIDIRNYETALGWWFTSLGTFKMTTNGWALGTRVEPMSLRVFDRAVQWDDIRVFVRNTSATTDVSLEAGSKFIISKR